MTKSLAVLQRLHRKTIDDIKEKLAELVTQGQQLEILAAEMRGRALAEATAAVGDPLAMSTIGAFVQDMRARAASVDRQRAEVSAEEAEARDALAAAFLEEKKVSLLIEAHEARARAAEAAAEAAMMDELAITRARQTS